MAWNVRYLPEEGIIEETFTGYVTAAEVGASEKECFKIAAEKDVWLFLTDMKNADIKVSVTEIFNVCQGYSTEETKRSMRVATIRPTDHKGRESVGFYETACTNRGWFVKNFDERDAAIEWLRGFQD